MSKALLDVKNAVGRLIGSFGDNGERIDYHDLVQRTNEIFGLWLGKDFTRYREAYGKCALMLTGGNPDNNPQFDSLLSAMGYFNGLLETNAPSKFDAKKSFRYVSGLYTMLALMEHQEDVINSAARGGLESCLA